jgi:hypothetical protein
MKMEIDAQGLRFEVIWKSVRAIAKAVLPLAIAIGALFAGTELNHVIRLLGG